MKEGTFFTFGKGLGLEPIETVGGVAVRGEIRGIEVFAAQTAIPVGQDPRPRPMTEITVASGGAVRGGLFAVSTGPCGATGDRAFDERFMWRSAINAPEKPPGYLADKELRAEILALDAKVASAVGHAGFAPFQIAHLEGTTRLLLICHLPEPELLGEAIQFLLSLSAEG